MAKKWKTVKDKNVRHVWGLEADDTGPEVVFCYLEPNWFKDNGTPLFSGDDEDIDARAEDGEDMSYLRTEVRL